MMQRDDNLALPSVVSLFSLKKDHLPRLFGASDRDGIPCYVKSLYNGAKSWGWYRGPVTLTYCFKNPDQDDATKFRRSMADVSMLNVDEQEMVRQSLKEWSDVAQITFTPETCNADTQLLFFHAEADRFNGYITTGQTAINILPANSFLLDGPYLIKNVTILLSPYGRQYPGNQLARASDIRTCIHEIGHALGLDHGFEADLFKPVSLALGERTVDYSIMNYDEVDPIIQPANPSPWDIAAVQSIFGPQEKTNAGDTTYKFTHDMMNLQYTKLFTIWDGGGRDTLDASQVEGPITISLREGPYSRTKFSKAQIMLALGSNIENVKGGRGKNIIFLNSQDNGVDIRRTQSSEIHTHAASSGIDTIFGFNSSRGDQIVVEYKTNSPTPSIQITDLPAGETLMGNRTLTYQSGTRLIFSEKNEMRLPGVMQNDLTAANLIYSEVDEKQTICIRDENLKTPIEFLATLRNAFFHGAGLVFISTFTEDVLNHLAVKYHWPKSSVGIIMNVFSAMLAFYSGNTLSLSVSRATSIAFEFAGVNSRIAKAMGTTIGIATQTAFSPAAGALNFVELASAVTVGSVGGLLGCLSAKVVSKVTGLNHQNNNPPATTQQSNQRPR